MTAIVDYVAMTITRSTPEDAVRVIGYEPDDFEPTHTTVEERRLYGYRHRWDNQWIKIMFAADNPDAGARVEMAGQACRQWESDHPEATIIDLLVAAKVVNAIMHRLDGAIDDYSNLLDLVDIENARTSKHFTFIGNKTRCQVGEDADDRTIYFGSRKSDIAFRMYRHRQADEQEWTRFEMETHRRKAQEFRDLILEVGSVGMALAGVTRHYLNFRVPKPGDTNKSRWDIAPFWLEFLSGAEKARLSKPKPTVRIEGVVAWLRRQARVYMALARRYGGPELIEAILNEGDADMKPHHLAMLPPELRGEGVDDSAPEDENDPGWEAEYAEYREWCEAEEANRLKRDDDLDGGGEDPDWDQCGFGPVLAARRLGEAS